MLIRRFNIAAVVVKYPLELHAGPFSRDYPIPLLDVLNSFETLTTLYGYKLAGREVEKMAAAKQSANGKPNICVRMKDIETMLVFALSKI